MPTSQNLRAQDPEAVDAALSGGADYVGLVFYPPSPRNFAPAAAAPLAARARGKATWSRCSSIPTTRSSTW